MIGGGGREHALVWSLSKSNKIKGIYCCPGNAGIAELAKCVDVAVDDFEALIDFAKYEWIECTIVGPEVPLARGIVDAFQREGLNIVGPQKRAAMLESSKSFAKDFLRSYKIPTAEYKVFSYHVHAKEYIRLKGAPIVVKADGLAAGKGVFVALTETEAFEAVDYIMNERAFGEAGDKVIIEECLFGKEASFMVFTDGNTVMPMVSSQDYKRIYENDKGPNTGGMGAYSPVHFITPEMEDTIMSTIMVPAIAGMKKEGINYKGVLYAGLMIKNGKPYVLEFNCRFGDPEAQAVLMRLDTDLLDIAMAINEERLHELEVKWKDGASVCVVLASKGYPGGYEAQKTITGLEDAAKEQDVMVFHSGTAFSGSSVVSSSGRVLCVGAYGADIHTAKLLAYRAIEKIQFDNKYFRRDIGKM